MIVGTDTTPQNQIYYIGGLILNILKRQTDVSFSYMDVFEKLNKEHKDSASAYFIGRQFDFIYVS